MHKFCSESRPLKPARPVLSSCSKASRVARVWIKTQVTHSLAREPFPSLESAHEIRRQPFKFKSGNCNTRPDLVALWPASLCPAHRPWSHRQLAGQTLQTTRHKEPAGLATLDLDARTRAAEKVQHSNRSAVSRFYGACDRRRRIFTGIWILLGGRKGVGV